MEEIVIGRAYEFDTHGQDSEWNCRSGRLCFAIRKLTEKECDIFDVGPMFRIRFLDGIETDAFIDELKEI